MEYGYENNHITISAELHACILYLSEEQEICFQEKVENFTNEINCDNADEREMRMSFRGGGKEFLNRNTEFR